MTNRWGDNGNSGSKITADGDAAVKLRRFSLEEKL